MEESSEPQLRRVDDAEFIGRVDELIRECGGDPDSFDGRLIREQLLTSLKLITDRRGTGELKLLTSTLKELRYAYNVFDRYSEPHKISIFGSARTKPGHPDYEAARVFSRMMAERGWLVITGAGDGIMKAGHEGPGRESSFGLAIRLPFETSANTVIKGDSKLINFRYFFTRKLMFVSQSEAVACFPGGFGTQDEIFEALTLVQTGKSAMIPIVLIEGHGGDYWKQWNSTVKSILLEKGMISPEDLSLFYCAADPKDATEHVCAFYKNYHSSRYVRDEMVLRLQAPLCDEDIERLNEEFADIVREGRMVQRGPFDVETDHIHLPRLAFMHTRRQFGLLRRLIDRINECKTLPISSWTPPRPTT